MITTVPFAGSGAEPIVFGAAVGVGVVREHVDRARGGVLATVALSSTAVGGSSTQVTVTETVAVEPPLSV